jgi:hypothetical protein
VTDLRSARSRYDLQGRRESAAFEYGASWLGDRARFAQGLPKTQGYGPEMMGRSSRSMTMAISSRFVAIGIAVSHR